MSEKLLLAWDDEDEGVAAEVRGALEEAGFGVARLESGEAPTPTRLALLLVTRSWSRLGAAHDLVETAERTGGAVLFVWWDEDAPSDFVGEVHPEERFCYACFVPRGERAAAVVERVRAELEDLA
jgi:hypothetical protein